MILIFDEFTDHIHILHDTSVSAIILFVDHIIVWLLIVKINFGSVLILQSKEFIPSAPYILLEIFSILSRNEDKVGEVKRYLTIHI